MSVDAGSLCVVCAWRENCRKKFNLPPGEAHCPDFSRDLSLPSAKDSSSEAGEGNKNSLEK
ncbi:MAG: hypothetical protein JRJ56_03325 [Deltaproteobacteria bacterium]|nr:hypothetical protein [Deltaproteobacteria bacterium]